MKNNRSNLVNFTSKDKSGGAIKILIIQQKMIGDVLTTSVLFETLKKMFPDSDLHYLIHTHTKPVVENNPFIDELILFSEEENRKPIAFFQFLKKIKKENYDVVIDVYAKINSALISYASGSKVRISFEKKYLKWAYTNTVETADTVVDGIPLAIYNRLEVLKLFGLPIDFHLTPKIFISEKERENLKIQLQKENISAAGKFIMVNCLGSEEAKTYPLKYMAAFLDEFSRTYPEKRFFLNYIPKQIEQVEKLILFCSEETKKRILKFYAPNLREFIVLTSFCEAVIGNEGGAINIGKALGLKTFAIFSPWIATEAWGHLNNNYHWLVHPKDYLPQMYEGKSRKEVKKDASLYYEAFKPELFTSDLDKFL